MFAIIRFAYREGSDIVYPVLNEAGGKELKLFKSLKEADNYANELEPNDEYRVISLESVHE